MDSKFSASTVRAQTGHGHERPDPQLRAITSLLADQRCAVVHQALDARHRRFFHDEKGKAHLDVARLGLETLGHLSEHAREVLD